MKTITAKAIQDAIVEDMREYSRKHDFQMYHMLGKALLIVKTYEKDLRGEYETDTKATSQEDAE